MTVPVLTAPQAKAAGRAQRIPFLDGTLAGFPLRFWVLQAYLLYETSQVHEHFPIPAFRPIFWLACLSCVFAATQVVARRAEAHQEGLRAQSQGVWLLLYFAACCLSTLWAFNAEASRNELYKTFTTVVYFPLLVILVTSRRELLVSALSICAGTGVFMALSLWEWFHGRYEIRMGVVRMVGVGATYSDPNSFASTLTTAAPILFWVALSARSVLLRLCALAYVAAYPYCIVKTSSRMGMVTLWVSLLWGWILLPGRRAKVAAVLVLGVGFAALWAGMSPEQRTRIEGIFNPATYSGEDESSAAQSAAGRIEGWKIAVRIFRENPLLGVGPGGFPAYREAHIDGQTSPPHNLAGQIISTVGLLGTVTFSGYLVTAVWRGARTARRGRRATTPEDRALGRLCLAGVAALSVQFLAGFGGHNLMRSSWFWIPALMLLADRHLRTDPDPAGGGGDRQAGTPSTMPEGPAEGRVPARGRSPRPWPGLR